MKKRLLNVVCAVWRDLVQRSCRGVMRRPYLALAASSVLFTGMGLAVPASATVIVPSPDFPTQAGAYLAFGPISFPPSGIVFVDLELDNFCCITTMPVGPDEVSLFSAAMSLTADDGSGPQPTILTGPTQWITFDKAVQTTGLFDTEIISMDLSGDVGGIPIDIRESPTLASVGQVAITDLGGGQFQIDSFFDVFLELSVADGPFQPADAAEPFLLTPEPTTALLLACGLVGLGVRRRLH